MSKKLILYTLSIITITALIASYASSRAVNGPISDSVHNECQYPLRPLVNGHCDNSDPANPETDIKGTIVKPKPISKPIIKKPINTCLQVTK